MTKKSTITIMADYGMGPYAWLRDGNQRRGVGGNIADSVCGFPDEYNVSKGLEKEFGDWAMWFETETLNGCKARIDCPTSCVGDHCFPWEQFHLLGVELTNRLRNEIGNSFNVCYVKPMEDPKEYAKYTREYPIDDSTDS